MEAGCGMWDVRNFNSGMRDEKYDGGTGICSVSKARWGERTSIGGIKIQLKVRVTQYLFAL